MKAIILAGGAGTRLFPLTQAISKQILPIYDKPMIYYPLSIMMLAGIRDVLIISTPRDLPMIEGLLGSGHNIGINISYKVQEKPNGIAECFIIADDWLKNDNGEYDTSCLILGDNIFYGGNLLTQIREASKLQSGANIFGYRVHDPRRYGVVNIDSKNKPIKIVEKPQNPESPWAVTGLYFYDQQVVNMAKNLKPSARGELEITDINDIYLQQGQLEVSLLSRGTAWLDAGTPESLHQASSFVKMVEDRQSLKIACIEEIAYRMGYINREELQQLRDYCGKGSYGEYLQMIMDERN